MKWGWRHDVFQGSALIPETTCDLEFILIVKSSISMTQYLIIIAQDISGGGEEYLDPVYRRYSRMYYN